MILVLPDILPAVRAAGGGGALAPYSLLPSPVSRERAWYTVCSLQPENTQQ
jgi:hypothetical protein